MTDPVQALISLAQTRPDPRVISQWVTAYLGKRPVDKQRAVLRDLEASFATRTGGAEARAAGLILRVLQRLQADLRA